MMEAAKNSRLSVMRVLFVLAAMVAIMAASALSDSSGLLGTQQADAATARKIQGTVFRSDTGQRVPYATVSLYWYKSSCSCWSYWKQGQANAYGQFNFYNSPTGYHYAVRAQKTIDGNTYGDWGKPFYLSPAYTSAFTSNVTIPIFRPW